MKTGFSECSHYSRCWLADQSDVKTQVDTTKAVRPLQKPDWDSEETREGDWSWVPGRDMSIWMLIIVQLHSEKHVELGHELQHGHKSADSKCVTPCATAWAKGYHPTADTAVGTH